MIRQVTFTDERAANRALIKMTEIAEGCGAVTVADLYNIIDKPNVRPNFAYGWYPENLSSAHIESFNGRHILRLDEAVLIEEN